MPRHVVECLLQDTIEMDGDRAIELRRFTLGLVPDFHAQLLFEHGKMLVQGGAQTDLVQDDRVQRTRKSANLIERGLYDFANLLQLRGERTLTFGALEHGADGGQNLAELIVQLS